MKSEKKKIGRSVGEGFEVGLTTSILLKCINYEV